MSGIYTDLIAAWARIRKLEADNQRLNEIVTHTRAAYDALIARIRELEARIAELENPTYNSIPPRPHRP